MFERTKKFLNESGALLHRATKTSKIASMGAAICGAAASCAMRVFADETGLNTEDVAVSSVLGKVIGIILTVAFAVGIMFLVIGIFQVVLAFKNDNPDQKHTAMTLAIIGAVLMGLKPTIKGVLTALGQDAIADAM